MQGLICGPLTYELRYLAAPRNSFRYKAKELTPIITTGDTLGTSSWHPGWESLLKKCILKFFFLKMLIVGYFVFSTGSFTSAPKAIPSTSADANDDDVYYPKGREDLQQFLQRCSQQLQGLPTPILRRWRKTPKYYCDKSKDITLFIEDFVNDYSRSIQV